MKILIIGGGPGGLYAGLLLKKDNPKFDIQIIERNPAGATYGWGVVFSDRTLRTFREADLKTYQQITDDFVLWQAIDIYYRDQLIRCGGHSFAGLSRRNLLNILQNRCRELEVGLSFETEFNDFSGLDQYDLVIAADGVNSIVRQTYADIFQPSLMIGKAKYIWFGTDKVLDAFTFIFKENQHGLFQVHAYPFDGRTSTFIVECEEAVWKAAGLDKASEEDSIAYCQELFAEHVDGRPLLSNKSIWINFLRVKNKVWRHNNIVLLGDSAHTAHFSIGSGTKLAMDGAIALANAFKNSGDLDRALNEYEMERRPRVQMLQEAALQSRVYFENIKRYLHLEPDQFAFHLLTRSGRITYDNLRVRDARYVDGVDGWYGSAGNQHKVKLSPPPMFTPFKLRQMSLPNRVVVSPPSQYDAIEGIPGQEYKNRLMDLACSGAGLVIVEPTAVSADGRITSGCPGLYQESHLQVWKDIVESVRQQSNAKIACQLNHAGRRGSTRPRQFGMDRPLNHGGWPLIAPSSIPYSPYHPAPREMKTADLKQVKNQFVQAAEMANTAGFDLLQLHFGHGYLLGSFISPLTNQRKDKYGGDLENRMRFPLELLAAVRKAWPEEKPISIAINATDWARGGLTLEDAVLIINMLHQADGDLFQILAGQTILDDNPSFGAGFLTSYSDFLRHETKTPTLVGGYLTNSGQINSILAAGRADLCIFEG